MTRPVEELRDLRFLVTTSHYVDFIQGKESESELRIQARPINPDRDSDFKTFRGGSEAVGAPRDFLMFGLLAGSSSFPFLCSSPGSTLRNAG